MCPCPASSVHPCACPTSLTLCDGPRMRPVEHTVLLSGAALYASLHGLTPDSRCSLRSGPRCKEQRGSKPFENPHDQPLCRGGCATSGEPFYSITAPPATIRIASGSSKHPLLPPQVAFMPSTRSTVVLLTPPHHRSLAHGALSRLRVCVRVGCFKVSFLSSWTKTDLSCY